MARPTQPRSPEQHLADGSISIDLTNGLRAVVDAVDAELVSGVAWHAHNSSRRGKPRYYAARMARRDGKRVLVYLHKLVADRAGISGAHLDHADLDSLNNRRANLRGLTAAQNVQNQAARGNQFKGVRQTRSGKFAAKAKVVAGGHIGTFDTAFEAAKAYDAAVLKHYGPTAWTNFPQGGE